MFAHVRRTSRRRRSASRQQREADIVRLMAKRRLLASFASTQGWDSTVTDSYRSLSGKIHAAIQAIRVEA